MRQYDWMLKKNEVSMMNYTALHLLGLGFYCTLYTEPRVSLAVAVALALAVAVAVAVAVVVVVVIVVVVVVVVGVVVITVLL